MACYNVVTVRETPHHDKGKGTDKMTKTTFIERLAQKANLTNEQSKLVVETIEEHNLFAKSEKPEIVEDIAKALKALAEAEDSKMLFGAPEAQPVGTGSPIGTIKGAVRSSSTLDDIYKGNPYYHPTAQ